MADDHNVLFVPHGWNTAVGLAADLQLVAAAGTPAGWSTSRPRRTSRSSARRRFTLDADGMLPIPTAPGLGIDLDPEGVARHSGGRAL